MGSKNNEYAQKCLRTLNKFQETIETNPNLSLSNDFRVSFKALASLLRKPEKHNIYSHLFLAMTGKADFYITSKPLLSKTKKFYNEIASVQDKDQSNLLSVSTFQEIFETYIGLELRDIAYDSKKFDFYIADEGGSEWDKIEHRAPQNIGAEYFGFKEKEDLMKKTKTLKFYGLTKFGKRRAKKWRINKSLLKNIDNLPHNYLEPFPNLEPSYIEFAKFDQVSWLYQRIVDLEVQVKPLIFLDSSLIFQLLLNFEANGKKFPSEFTEQISNQFELVCLPGVLFDLEKAGYTEFVIEFLKEVINLPKLLEIEKFVINYQDKLDEYGFSNLNIGILSDSVYWNFYVQFHACVAKFLKADTILITSNLKKHYLNKNCYNGKFSFFVEPGVKPTSLKCITAKKFWKKFRLEKQKVESDNLKNFVVSSNFKEWMIPNCLSEILKDLDQKLIKDVNTFWLDIFRISENLVENKNYFKDFVDLIKIFEENANILKNVPQYSSLIDNGMHYRANFSDIKDYISKVKRVFTYLIEVNKNKGFFNSNELYSIVLLFKSNVSNFLRDRFYLKAKFKSPELPTTINFDLYYKNGDIRRELSSIIPTKYRSNTLQNIILKSKGKNKNSIRFEPKLQYNDEFIIQLFRKFLFTTYCFHKDELETVYRDFIRFIKAKKDYRAIAKDFSFNRFESLILNTQERSLILVEPHGIYYSKLLENFLLLIESYHRVHNTSLSLELSAKILRIMEKELEILIYFLIQNGNMFRENSIPNPRYSLFLQNIKELNDKSTKRPQAMNYSPFWFPKKKKKKKNKIELSQPEIWIEYESEVLDSTPIYYVDKENRVSYSDRLFNVEIKGETFAADVDTGAFKSLMSNDIAERLFPKQKRYITYVSGYTQHTKRVDMIKDIPFHYNGQTFTDDFLIEKNLEKIFRTEVVIGKDGYNKMLVRYYGKTLDNLFDNNLVFKNFKISSSEKGVFFINDSIKENTGDAGTLLKSIREQISMIPDPCYCIRKATYNSEFFSVLLGLKPYYFKYKVHMGQRGIHLGLDLLNKIEDYLMQSFDYWIKKETNTKLTNEIYLIKDNIKMFIEKYKTSNELKLYTRGNNGILERHPDLKLDYFKNIDTLEKAYWLGWLFAEAYIRIKKLKSGLKYYQFGVGIGEGDFILLERFADALGLNIIDYEPRKEEYITSKGEIHILRRITLISNTFCNNLISHGFIVGKEKSKNIRLPNFKNRELLLAFLLGHYDGDGTMGRSRITSSSKKFLEDILNSSFLNIPVSNSNSVQFDKIKKKYIVKGENISLGTDLLREMVKNYKKSLPRKRVFWENWVDKRTLGLNRPAPKMDFLFKNLPEKKLLDLYLVENYTLKKIAKMHKVSYDTLKKYMRKIGLKGL